MTDNQRIDDTWLEEHLSLLGSPNAESRVLELGCGEGQDTLFLTNKGFKVTTTDISSERLETCTKNVPQAIHHLVDIREPLPFADGTFSIILASLCLHYFDWNKTHEVIAEIRRCLEVNGLIIARVNSTDDVNYGAVGFEEISPNFYSVFGKSKRFFNDSMLTELFANGWEIMQMEKRSIDRYGKLKAIWQLMARRV